MKKIQINVGYSEKRNCKYFNNFTVLDERPQVGDYFEGETVLGVKELRKDINQPNDNAYLAEAYELSLTLNGFKPGEEDYDENTAYAAYIPDEDEYLDFEEDEDDE